MSEFIAYPLEILNETYLNLSHAHVSQWFSFFLIEGNSLRSSWVFPLKIISAMWLIYCDMKCEKILLSFVNQLIKNSNHSSPRSLTLFSLVVSSHQMDDKFFPSQCTLRQQPKCHYYTCWNHTTISLQFQISTVIASHLWRIFFLIFVAVLPSTVELEWLSLMKLFMASIPMVDISMSMEIYFPGGTMKQMRPIEKRNVVLSNSIRITLTNKWIWL